ncbi:hypothetical protein EMCRGX_G010412 [Ephydatia muelleri]
MSITNGSSHHVRVVVRTKPTANFAQDLIKLEDDGKTVSVHLPKSWDQLKGYINNQQQDWSFKVDQVLHNTPQEEVYTTCAQEIVTRLMDGYNGTILAYGETGSGKTHTVTGPIENYRLRGIIPRAISQVFRESKDRVESSITIRVSYLEIYNEAMYDLLSTLPDSNPSGSARCPSSVQQLSISEDEQAVFVKGLTVRVASTEEEALSMLFEGEMNRTIAEHSLNKSSSRSHCLFTIHVESRSRTSSSTEYTVSKLNLVDLAGSERLSKTNSTGIVQKEAMYINKSLSFLEQVIVALADKNRDHIPYRQSKLTHVLKDSLGGNCSTLMIANIWVEADKIEETISTLRFAMRMMCVSTEPVQNVLVDPRLLVKKYEQEIRTLKQELAMHDTLVNRTSISYEPLSEGQISDIQRHIHQFVEGALQEIPIVTVQQINEVFAQFKAIIVSLQSDKAAMMKQPSLPAVLVAEPVSTKSSSPTYKQPKSRTVLSVEVSEDQQVGDTDGAGFGVGVAPSNLKHPSSPITTSKKMKAAKKTTSAAPDTKRMGSAQTKGSGSPVPSVEEPAMEKPQQEPDGEPRPSTPPTRSDAFEDFKKGRGSEINKILLTNKETFSQKKKESHDLSTSINDLKRRIDEVRDFLKSKERERSEHGAAITTESGDPIIEEQEFKALAELKTLKAQYHSQYEQLQARQAEMQYCKQYINQCRDRLLSEFDVWYAKSFLGLQQGPVSTDGEIPKSKQDAVESDQEKFDQLQAALLKGDPATTAFYNALLRTEKRVYQAAPVKRRPGQMATSVRTKPPGVMTFT